MRLLAVVVLYHPGKDLAGNINSYLPQVDRLLLWDNTPGGGKEQLPLSGVTHPERLEYRGCGRNVGIGTALNDAVAYAREHGYTHLLTLDQDSYFLPEVFRDYTELRGGKAGYFLRQLFYKVSAGSALSRCRQGG